MFLSNGSVIPAPDVIGDRSPMLVNGNYYATSSLALSGTWAAYSALYKQQLWVGVVVRKLARGQARLPFEVWMNQSGPGKALENGNLAELLARPNPRLNGFRLWEWTSSIYDIYGEAFWLKLRDSSGRVRELWPMHPTNVVLRRNDAGDYEYVWTLGGRSALELPGIPESDVVAFVNFNPDDTKRGLSNLEGLRMTLLNEDASRRATASFWRRGARPSVVLKHPKTLSDPAFKRLKETFDANHAGADNTGATNILEEGLDLQVIQLNLEEMQYIESRKLNREEVCSSYDVPPPAVHILDHATFSNITEQLRSMYRDTMAPRSTFFESIIDQQLVPDFYSAFGESFTKFNMDEVLRGDFETRATAVSSLVQTAVFKPSEARPLFNLPPADAVADQLFANAALVPLGSTGQAKPQVATDGSLIPQAIADAPPLKAIESPRLTVRSLMGGIHSKATKAEVKATLVAAHEKELGAFFDKQHASVKAAVTTKASGMFAPGDWDNELAGILHTLSEATAKAIGGKVAKQLGGKYDGDDIANYLQTNSADTAVKINQATLGELQKAFAPADDDEDDDEGDDVDPEGLVDDVFDGHVAARASQISLSRVATIAGLASLVAARQSSARTKTWVVTSGNPRSSHADMDGETVGIDESFSNGMDGPGDYNGGADEVAGCTCDLEFSVEDNS